MSARHMTLKYVIANQIVIPTLAYGRVSSEKQLAGEGLARQRKGIIEWIAKHPELNIRLDVGSCPQRVEGRSHLP